MVSLVGRLGGKPGRGQNSRQGQPPADLNPPSEQTLALSSS